MLLIGLALAVSFLLCRKCCDPVVSNVTSGSCTRDGRVDGTVAVTVKSFQYWCCVRRSSTGAAGYFFSIRLGKTVYCVDDVVIMLLITLRLYIFENNSKKASLFLRKYEDKREINLRELSTRQEISTGSFIT